MNIHKQRLAFLDPNEELSEDIVYPKIILYYFNDDIKDYPVRHRLFDETPEQVSHGMAPWDKFGWSRDGWVI